MKHITATSTSRPDQTFSCLHPVQCHSASVTAVTLVLNAAPAYRRPKTSLLKNMPEICWRNLSMLKPWKVKVTFGLGLISLVLNLTNKVSLIWSPVWQPWINLIIWQVFLFGHYFRSTNNYFRSTTTNFRRLQRWQTWRGVWRRLNLLTVASERRERRWWSSWQGGRHPGQNWCWFILIYNDWCWLILLIYTDWSSW